MKAQYIYWKREAKTDAWKFIEESELPDMIQRKGAMFATWMSFEAEPLENENTDYEKMAVRRFGDLPIDVDAKDNMEKARKTAVAVVETFIGMGVPQDNIGIFVSGSKGFHIIINRKTLGSEDGDPLLPLIYKDMINDIFPSGDIRFEAIDRSLYCMKHGKMFRLPNVKRENGHYKIPITFEELRDTEDAESLLEMSENPRPLFKSPEYSSVMSLFKAYVQKQAFEHSMARGQKLPKREIKIGEKEMLPCTRILLKSTQKMSRKVTFNQLCFSGIVPSLIEAGYTHDEIPFIPEVESFLENFEDSEGYKTPAERIAHFKTVVSRDRNNRCGFSCGAMMACLGNNDDQCRTCKPRINAWLSSEEDGSTINVTDPHDDNPDVEYLLKNFSWVHIGGKEAIYRRREGTGELEFLSKAAFDGMFANRPPVVMQTADGKIKTIPVTTIWRQHPQRVTYEGGVTFDPSNSTPKDVLNTWRGFPMEMPEMSVGEAKERCKLFRQHVENILCKGNKESIKFLWAWLSDMVKHPGGKKPGSAVVLVGGKGVGKSLVARPFKKIMGYYAMTLGSPDGLLSHFNSSIADKILLVLEEAVWGGSHEAESRLKSLITETSMRVERKGFDAVEENTYQRVMMCSNEDWVIPSSADERRFFVLDVGMDRQPREYYDKLIGEIDNGGAEGLFVWLSSLQLEDEVCLFDPPRTAGLDNQKMESARSTVSWWHDVLMTGELVFDDKGIITKTWDGIFDSGELYRAYTTWCKTVGLRAVTRRKFSTSLFGKGGVTTAKRTQRTVDGVKMNVYAIGSIEQARKDFQKAMKLSDNYAWDDAVQAVSGDDFDI